MRNLTGGFALLTLAMFLAAPTAGAKEPARFKGYTLAELRASYYWTSVLAQACKPMQGGVIPVLKVADYLPLVSLVPSLFASLDVTGNNGYTEFKHDGENAEIWGVGHFLMDYAGQGIALAGKGIAREVVGPPTQEALEMYAKPALASKTLSKNTDENCRNWRRLLPQMDMEIERRKAEDTINEKKAELEEARKEAEQELAERKKEAEEKLKELATEYSDLGLSIPSVSDRADGGVDASVEEIPSDVDRQYPDGTYGSGNAR